MIWQFGSHNAGDCSCGYRSIYRSFIKYSPCNNLCTCISFSPPENLPHYLNTVVLIFLHWIFIANYTEVEKSHLYQQVSIHNKTLPKTLPAKINVIKKYKHIFITWLTVYSLLHKLINEHIVYLTFWHVLQDG